MTLTLVKKMRRHEACQCQNCGNDLKTACTCKTSDMLPDRITQGQPGKRGAKHKRGKRRFGRNDAGRIGDATWRIPKTLKSTSKRRKRLTNSPT